MGPGVETIFLSINRLLIELVPQALVVCTVIELVVKLFSNVTNTVVSFSAPDAAWKIDVDPAWEVQVYELAPGTASMV
mgnify:FL=1